MTPATTSATRPLRVAKVVPDRCWVRIGITLCPGQKDPHGMTCAWNRRLDCDVDMVERWGATAAVTLVTDREWTSWVLADSATRPRPGVLYMERWHLPVRDVDVPGPGFERRWDAGAGEAVRDRLCLGLDALIHCKGRLRRARLLAELGEDSEDTIETPEQGKPRQARQTGTAGQTHPAPIQRPGCRLDRSDDRREWFADEPHPNRAALLERPRRARPGPPRNSRGQPTGA